MSLLFALVLMVAMVGEAFGQRSFGRSGGFGGGRSTFGGGGSFGRSSSSGSFGRSSGGFFGGGRSSGTFSRPSTPSYSRPSTPSFSGPRSSTGSFGRSGTFGNSGRVNSSSANPSRNYGGGYGNYGGNRTTIMYGGMPYYSGGGFWSGYAVGTLMNPWTHWVPFHPGFYTTRPYYTGGVYHEGGFSFGRLILGIIIIAGIVWLLARLFGGGGSKNIRYTNYR
ncbi:hypothetical protein EON82_18945 [bacterium]|nr:MAG: hypothetical protein EON82_18945 [bacterium]